MLTQYFQEVTKTYKTPENAIKALEKVISGSKECDIRFSISTVKKGEEYRFVPVVHLNTSNHHRASFFTSNGICVTG